MHTLHGAIYRWSLCVPCIDRNIIDQYETQFRGNTDKYIDEYGYNSQDED